MSACCLHEDGRQRRIYNTAEAPANRCNTLLGSTLFLLVARLAIVFSGQALDASFREAPPWLQNRGATLQSLTTSFCLPDWFTGHDSIDSSA